MKNSLLLRTLLIASALASPVAHATDPQPAPAAADLQKLMAMLNHLAAEAGVELTPEAEAAPAPAAKDAPAPPVNAPAVSPPAMRLRMSSLSPSSPLGGRGAGASYRAAASDWRTLFPLKQPRN